MKTYIKNRYNRDIGYCDDDGSIVTAICYGKGYVGRYIKSTNITFDSKQNVFGFGDYTAALILSESDDK